MSGAPGCVVCGAPAETGHCGACGHRTVEVRAPSGSGLEVTDPAALVLAERERALTRLRCDVGALWVSDPRLVEVGASTGAFCAAARAAGYVVRGLEASHERRELARRCNDVELEAGELGDSGLDGLGAGFVVLTEVLATSPAPLELLSSARRVLNPLGALVCVLPVGEESYPGASGAPAGPDGAVGAPDRRQRFTPTSLERALTRSGFRVVDAYARGGEEVLVVGAVA